MPAAAPVGAATDPAAIWRQVIEMVAANPSVAPIAEPLTLEKVEGNVALVIAPSTTSLGAARTRRGALEEALSKVMGRTVRLEIRAAESAAAPSAAPVAAVDTAARAQAMNNPLVRRAVELFDARVVDVQDES